MIALLLTFLCVSALGRVIPRTPCPHLFNYYEDDNHQVFGGMTFTNDLSGEFRLQVNMSVPMVTEKNIRIVRATPDKKIKNGADIEYHIRFPFDDKYPVLTSVVFNGKVYCSGPPYKETTEHGVTTLSATDFFKIVRKTVQVPASTKPWTLPQTVRTTPQSTHRTQNTRVTAQPSIQTTILNRFTEQYQQCGTVDDFTPLVIHGKPTKSGEYPWLVAMFHLDENGNYKFRCAANLISQNHVVTAAHCVKYMNSPTVQKEDLVLIMGKHNLKTWAIKSTIRGVKEIYVHPEFYQPGDGDVAVMQLQESVQFSSNIRAICLWAEETRLEAVTYQEGVVAGWGRDENDREYVDEPRQISLPIVSQEDCLRSDDRFLRITSNRTFCAGDGSGAAPCSGDSGGGFVMRRNGKWYLRGIVSVALLDRQRQACDNTKYVVFADVAKYSEWILTTVRKTTLTLL